jgi:hypothetical protein
MALRFDCTARPVSGLADVATLPKRGGIYWLMAADQGDVPGKVVDYERGLRLAVTNRRAAYLFAVCSGSPSFPASCHESCVPPVRALDPPFRPRLLR